jgi:hypothetical protein
MSARSSSAGLRSEGLFDRIRAERNRHTPGAAARRLAHVAEAIGNTANHRGAEAPRPRPARLRGRKKSG